MNNSQLDDLSTPQALADMSAMLVQWLAAFNRAKALAGVGVAAEDVLYLSGLAAAAAAAEFVLDVPGAGNPLPLPAENAALAAEVAELVALTDDALDRAEAACAAGASWAEACASTGLAALVPPGYLEVMRPKGAQWSAGGAQ
jgi:hypothetical protein